MIEVNNNAKYIDKDPPISPDDQSVIDYLAYLKERINFLFRNWSRTVRAVEENVNVIETTADYVVEQGITSPWNWRKWNSGRVDLWCRKTFQNLTFTASGSVYVADLQPFAYPFDLVNATAVVETVSPVGVTTTPDTAIWVQNKGGGTGPTNLSTGTYQAVKTTDDTATVHVVYNVHGRLT